MNMKFEIRNSKSERTSDVQTNSNNKNAKFKNISDADKTFWSFEHLNFEIVSNFVLRASNLKLGFTLVELLVVTVLIGLIGMIITEMFILGFRSQAKSEITKEVKQNGDYTMSVIEAMVRNAVNISQNCNTNADSLTIVNQDRLITTFLCPTGFPQHMASVSSGFIPPVPTVSQSLTSNRVAVTNCTFRVVCPTPPLSPKYVYINYTVSQAVPTGEPTPQPEGRASMKYQATFTLRNYE